MVKSFGVELIIVRGRMYYVEYLNSGIWTQAAQFIHEHDANAYAANMRRFLTDVRVRKAVRCVGGACGE